MHPTTPHPLHSKSQKTSSGSNNWGNVESQNISTTTQYILLSSWRKSTGGWYNSVLQQWHNCGREETTYLLPYMTSVVKFFTELHEKGCQHSSVTLARSALTSVVTLRGSTTCSLTKRFIKGVYHLAPSKPKYSSIWDADILLRYWQQIEDNSHLNLLKLSKKVTTLLALFTWTQNKNNCKIIWCQFNHYVKMYFLLHMSF